MRSDLLLLLLLLLRSVVDLETRRQRAFSRRSTG